MIQSRSRRRASTARNRGSTKKAKREANCRLTVGKQPSLRTTTTGLGVSTGSKSRAGGEGEGERRDRTGAKESKLRRCKKGGRRGEDRATSREEVKKKRELKAAEQRLQRWGKILDIWITDSSPAQYCS